jgi:hypothetical protein
MWNGRVGRLASKGSVIIASRSGSLVGAAEPKGPQGPLELQTSRTSASGTTRRRTCVAHLGALWISNTSNTNSKPSDSKRLGNGDAEG